MSTLDEKVVESHYIEREILVSKNPRLYTQVSQCIQEHPFEKVNHTFLGSPTKEGSTRS